DGWKMGGSAFWFVGGGCEIVAGVWEGVVSSNCGLGRCDELGGGRVCGWAEIDVWAGGC
ncbi:hypothetical protein A2U01_0076800, partial [Trifolium medium]|nr:hypothetical protein [Trifolium medium]